MARYPGTLESANTNEFGIVFADHIQGHKTVANLNALYNISDAILSKSKTNAGNDAIGQEWYVVSEGYYYRLDNWANRRQASGWRKLQNTDEEFDSLQNHGADKIKNFTTTDSTVSLNYNTWKNSTTSIDGSVTIPAATGDQAGVLTANGKDQLTQLNKIGELTHLTDGGVFTEEASTVTVHYSCINTKEGATSAVVAKSEAIPEATLTNAGVLSAAKRNQLEQLDKIGEVTHLTDGGVFTTDANTATIHYQCIDTNSGANSAVSTKTANIPAATLTNAGVLDAAHRNQLEQLDKIGEVTHLTDNGVFTTDANTVTLHYQCIDTDAGANSAVSTKTAVIPEATLTNAGTLASSNRNQLEQLNKIEKTSFLHHTSDNSSATFTSTGSAVTLHWDTIDTTDGANSEVTERSANIPVASSTSAGTMSSTDKIEHDRISTVNFALGSVTPSTTTVQIAASKTNITNGSSVNNNITIPGVTETAAGVMSSADKAKLNDITIPEGGVNFSGKETDIINGAGDSVDLMAKFPATVITNLTGVTPSTSSATINFSKSAKDTLDYNAATSNTITIPAATTSAAGLMSSTDKTEHDRINTANFALGAVTPNTTVVAIAASKTNITNGSSVANNITIPGVTESAAGVMSAADKAKLNDITIPEGGVDFSGDATDVINGAGDSVDLMAKFPTTVVTNLTGVTLSTSAATINFTRSAKDTLDYNAATSNTVTIPGATTSAAGLMSATDKTEHDRITTTNFTLGAVTPSASTVQIAATKTTISTGASAANNITLPAVTESAAGVMSAADKAKLNDITLPTGGVNFSGDETDIINGAGDSVDLMAKFPATVITNITGVTPNTTSATINFTKSAKDTLDYNAATNNTVTIPAVTESAAGLMSSADKAKLNDIQFVQSLTATGTQVVAVTSDTVVINSASQLNVTGINANAYNKVRFVNATSINTLFTFNDASAGNNKLLTTYYPSQIALPRYCSVEFVKSSTGWILSDLTGVTYFPDVTASETMVVTVNADRSIGTLPIRTMKEWDETVTQEQSVSQLNQRFPDAPVGFQFVCVSINRVYEKFNETNEWICHYIWETGTEGTATSTDKGLMSAADKVKLDTTIPNYTVNGMKISTNPVLDGADIRLTGYSKPSSTSGIAATDTINAALGKLETGLSNEVTNRTKADSNLQSQITNLTNLNNGKVSSVTKSGTGAVITGGSISGSTLTLTSGNFTFANGSSGNFTVTPPGGAAQTVSIGKPATAGTADVAKSVAWGNVSGKVNASTSANGLMTTAQVTKLNGIAAGAEVNQNAFSNVVVGGTTIAADAKTDTLTLIAGSNVTLTPNATNDSVTIASSYVNTTYAAGSNLTLSGTTFALASTISLTRVNASSGFFQQSDKRLKSDIKPLEHTIEDICSIPTDSFILNGKQDLGTIAQDLEEKFPEVVSECELKAAEVPNPENFTKVEKDGETYVLVKEVDYAKLSILALEGIKLLKAEIDRLKEELASKNK